METRLFDDEPLTGTRRLWHYDPETEVATIETVQDVTERVEANKGAYNMLDERAGWKGALHRVASIPLNVYYDLKRKGVVDDQKQFKAWLNDRDNLVFRTRPGKV